MCPLSAVHLTFTYTFPPFFWKVFISMSYHAITAGFLFHFQSGGLVHDPQHHDSMYFKHCQVRPVLMSFYSKWILCRKAGQDPDSRNWLASPLVRVLCSWSKGHKLEFPQRQNLRWKTLGVRSSTDSCFYVQKSTVLEDCSIGIWINWTLRN